MTRRAYAREYYWRTVERRRQLANKYRKRLPPSYWAAWIIAELRKP